MTTRFDRESLRASIARDSFIDFVKEFWDAIIPENLVWNWHLEYLCEELQKVAERVFKGIPKEYDLVINISPGTSKSTLCSIMYPAWCWTRMPACRIISASYAHSLAMDLSRKSRDLIKSDQYRKWYPEISVREDQDTKSYFINGKGGDRYAVGVNGSVTGMHAHILIVDDPIDPNQAVSEVELRGVNHWMENTLPSRKVNKAVTPLILIQQRLHENDPAGLLLEKKKQGKAKIFHICLPAELPPKEKCNVSPPELRKKYVKGLMDPVRLSKDVLEEFKSNGIYSYSSQFMQSPIPLGGGLFQLEYFNQRRKAAPFNCSRIRYWDRAATEAGGNFTVGVLMAKDEEGFYVEHVERGQWEPGDRNNKILAVAKRDRTRYGRYEPRIYVEAEGGSSGRDAWKAIARKLAGFPIFEDRVTGNKEVRAHPWSAQLQAGNVWIIEDGTWDVNVFIAEHCSFPLGKHDDQVDSSSGSFNLLVNRTAPLGIKTISLKDKKKQQSIQILVCGWDDMPTMIPRDKAILVRFYDPLEQIKDNKPQDIQDIYHAVFADINPEDYQERWEKKISPYKKKPGDLIMTREQGKSLWSFLLKKRAENPRLIVFQGSDDRKAVSVAAGFCEAFRRRREDIVLLGSGPYNEGDGVDENRHVVEMMKSTRNMVV